MNWKKLENLEQLATIKQASFESPQIIFKHSTQCNISADAFEEMNKMNADAWYLDLLKFRPISNQIAIDFDVIHKSPQVLIIKNGMSTYNESHWKIKVDAINEEL